MLFCIDNYQEQLNTKYQRGKYSSGTMDGTNEILHRVCPYTDTSFGSQYVEVAYSSDQVQPSPVNMRRYEEMTDMSASEFFETHNQK